MLSKLVTWLLNRACERLDAAEPQRQRLLRQWAAEDGVSSEVYAARANRLVNGLYRNDLGAGHVDN